MATIKLMGLSNGLQKRAGDTDTLETDGSLTVGNSDTDTIIVNAEFDSDLVPDDTHTYDLGESGKVLWHDKPKSLAEVLTKTSKMLLEARDYGKGDVIFSYDVRGFDKIIDKLK